MNRLIGVFLVALYASLVATNPVFARISYDAGANPVTFLFIRFLIASPVMFMIMMTGRLWVFRLPMVYIATRILMMGPNGIYYSMILSNLSICTVGLIMFLSGKWQKKIIKQKKAYVRA